MAAHQGPSVAVLLLAKTSYRAVVQTVFTTKFLQRFDLLLIVHRQDCGVLQLADPVVEDRGEVLVGILINGGVGGLDSDHEVELIELERLSIFDTVITLKLLRDRSGHRLREVF